jgi:hypothetical protein
MAVGRDPRVDQHLAAVFGQPAWHGADRLEEWLVSVGIEPAPAAAGIVDARQRLLGALTSPRGRNFIGSEARRIPCAP